MTQAATPPTLGFDTELDLVIERSVAVPSALAWEAWTRAEHFGQWFRLPPYVIEDVLADVRPGGGLSYTMRAPGDVQHKSACYLEVVPNERLAWTDALVAGYRPSELPFFTALVTFEPDGDGTRYRVTVLHRGEPGQAGKRTDAWNFVLGQFEELALGLAASIQARGRDRPSSSR